MNKNKLVFQSLGEKSFYTLNNKQMQTVLGGTATPGGTQKNGPTEIIKQGNKTTTRVPIRSYTADSIVNGLACYTDLEECVQETVSYS